MRWQNRFGRGRRIGAIVVEVVIATTIGLLLFGGLFWGAIREEAVSGSEFSLEQQLAVERDVISASNEARGLPAEHLGTEIHLSDR